MLSRVPGLVLMGLLVAATAFAQETTSIGKPLSGAFKASVASLTSHTGAPTLLPPQKGAPPSTPPSQPASQAERPPKFEVSLGYLYTSFSPPGPNHNLNGGIGSVAGNINRWLGLEAEVTGSNIGGMPAGAGGTMYTYLFGPRFARRSERVTPFVHALAGVAHLNVDFPATSPQSATLLQGTSHQTAFAMALGGGFDVNLGKRFAWRLVEGDYLFTKFTDGATNLQNSFRANTGLLYKFRPGQPPPPPNHPPIVTLTTNTNQVFVGESALLQAHANDPDNDPLTYTWSFTGGKVDGTGSDVRWASADSAPGRYTITVKVDDGRGGAATASTEVSVTLRPNRPPTISICAADPATIVAGQTANITMAANDPDNDPLTSSFSASGGKVTGEGPQAKFDSTGLAPGRYTVTCHVEDGKGGAADGSAEIEVQSPQQKQLETRLSLHSIYFPTAQPTVQDPEGGLLASQRRTLLALANDFKQYLALKPEARLVLQGHADPRGSAEYNKALSMRRVARAKSFLVEQGVAADHLETQGLGEEQPMTTDQVKQVVDMDPNLTSEQKRQLLQNASVLALAQNRRVDVTLSTTGETSVRKFPFNAEDALNLISPKGARKSAAAAGKKPSAKKPK